MTGLPEALVRLLDLSGASFDRVVFADCTFEGAVFSAATAFHRCVFTGAAPEPGAAKVTACTVDGVLLPDRWLGEAEAQASEDRWIERIRAAVADGTADDLPLDPSD